MFILLGACSAASGNNSATDSNAVADGGASAGTPTPTPTPTTSITSVTYDRSIGDGVDANGFADLPLHAGANRYYVNSSTGSDGNGCATAKNPATPLATVGAADNCVTPGNGDQVLVAEGTTYSAALPDFEGKNGFSAVYPTVIESYDPADPTNEAKFGRATGNNRPVFTATTNNFLLNHVGTNYVAVRGLDFNPGNVTDGEIRIVQTGGLAPHNYILFENDRFQYVSVEIDQSSAASRASKLIFRNSSFHGQWSTGGNAQGIYVSNVDGVTIEDSVFWHAGWKEGANRTDSASLGGATIFSHPFYLQDDTRNNVVRRNVLIDCAADGGRPKGGGVYTQNLSLNNPIGVDTGGGNTYSVDAPNGVNTEVSYNVIIGGGQIAGMGTAQDWGIHVVNASSGSSAHHNVIAHSSGGAGSGLMASADADTLGIALPVYVDFDNNVLYQWTSTGSTSVYGGALAHVTFNYNIWGNPASGTNMNVGSITFPNAYTADGLAATLGYASLDAARAQWIANPDQRAWRPLVATALAGYGVDTSAMTW